MIFVVFLALPTAYVLILCLCVFVCVILRLIDSLVCLLRISNCMSHIYG